jgi:hypothetical protein
LAPSELRTSGIHGPDVTRESDAFGLADDFGGEAPAKYCDVPGSKKTRKTGASRLPDHC